MEELVLTDPVVVPEKVTNKYRVVSFTMDLESQFPSSSPSTPGVMMVGQVAISLKDNNGVGLFHRYEGDPAISMIKTLNTANLSTKSMHKRILEKLSADGIIPGTVSGTPDPPTVVE